jgi:SAM-dependent methyltransferase
VRRELLIGCGSRRNKLAGASEWSNLTTLDMNPAHKPDVVWNLEALPLPFEEDSFDEVHAYEVLEHTGSQGDYEFFFKQWSDFWRILKPGGMFFATVPYWKSKWAWGDPSHKRVVQPESLIYLDQNQYSIQVGKTPMSDFRFCYTADFELVMGEVVNEEEFRFALRAIKPSRINGLGIFPAGN